MAAHAWLLIIMLFSSLCFCQLVVASQNMTCDPNDLQSLKMLFAGFKYNWTTHTNSSSSSSSSDCCQWLGVTCAASRVTKLELNLHRMYYGNLTSSIASLTELKTLNLSMNYLKGRLPDSLFTLRNLEVLDLSHNDFSGLIPSNISLPKLLSLDLSDNQLVGSLPAGLGNCALLRNLQLGFNDLSDSFLTGKIELNCSAMTSLETLDLSFNRFTGFVPGNLPYCTSLRGVNLDGNSFSGGIPESFKEFQSLRHLSISNANLVNISGALEVLQNCKNLQTLVLSKNFFDEELPSNSNLQFEKLRVLIISSCRLSGSAPLWLKESKNMQVLDLSWNRLNGQLPNWFGYFESLFYLDLSNNAFGEEIPNSLTGLKSLISGDILFEEISPDFPFFFTKRPQFYPVRNFLPTLRLGNNYLTGPIWPGFGNLKKLYIFDLKYNKLSGTIPSELSGMASLETMDLSHNQLSGVIPSSLAILSLLSEFSVAYNNLHGNIPKGGQFGTFFDWSFEGNPGLCRINSPCEDVIKQPREENSNSQDQDGYYNDVKTFAGVGFATGFLFVIWIKLLLHFCR